ncbi:MAG: hypothetical protein WCI61_00530, partial [Chloroflexota bacterium]
MNWTAILVLAALVGFTTENATPVSAGAAVIASSVPVEVRARSIVYEGRDVQVVAARDISE